MSVAVRALPRHAGSTRRLAHRVVLYGLVLALAGWILGPFLWLFVTSISYQRNLLARPFTLIPPEITAENYRMIFGLVRFHAEVQASRILPALLNSVIVAVAVTGLNLVIGSAAGYDHAVQKGGEDPRRLHFGVKAHQSEDHPVVLGRDLEGDQGEGAGEEVPLIRDTGDEQPHERAEDPAREQRHQPVQDEPMDEAPTGARVTRHGLDRLAHASASNLARMIRW